MAHRFTLLLFGRRDMSVVAQSHISVESQGPLPASLNLDLTHTLMAPSRPSFCVFKLR